MAKRTAERVVPLSYLPRNSYLALDKLLHKPGC